MRRFNIGDTVTRPYWGNSKYEVTEVRGDNDIKIGGYWYTVGSYERDWVLVSKASPKVSYIICSKNAAGDYAPSVSPRIFSSEKQALTVAKKMADEHGGTFTVFRAIAEAYLPKADITVTVL